VHARTISFLLLFAAGALAQQQMALRADVVIYGGTPSGLAAAEAVVRSGASAIVVEPTSHIGGMITGGIAITDATTPQLVGGIAAELFNQVAAETHR
jgi:ribulose 1,5-bisphosphate synthetase/thiazole synthase